MKEYETSLSRKFTQKKKKKKVYHESIKVLLFTFLFLGKKEMTVAQKYICACQSYTYTIDKRVGN